MAKELKNLMVKEYVASLKDKKNFVLVSYQGVNSLEAVEYREKLKKSGVVFSVVKNSLIAIAFKELGIPDLKKYVHGQCAVAANIEECVVLAKALVDCEKKVENFKINGGFLDGRQVSLANIVELSKIPDRSVVNAQILAGIRSPMVGIANGLNGVLRKLAVCFKEIKEKKQ
ncbi:MAG: 50S ribosomal protein L10 [Candidatus Anammoxibacter sp.]